MLAGAMDLAFNVGHTLQVYPPNYVRSILGDPSSWRTETCPPTELKLAELREWRKGLPELARILIPALPWQLPGLSFPFSDLLFRPSRVFRYPASPDVQNPTPEQSWFFINGICTDRAVVDLNAQYLHDLFRRPLTILHNATRGFIPDLVACAAGKEWDTVTESAAIAFPPVYAALKNPACERLILLSHSQGTILSAVILDLLKGLHPPIYESWAKAPVVAGERAVARKLAKRWDFERTMRAAQTGKDPRPAEPASFEWPGYGRRQPETVTAKDWLKLEMYCFANCASEMVQIKVGSGNGLPVPWIESYGNENDIVARLGVLANAAGPGSVRIDGDRYKRNAWGHLLNAHYLYPMFQAKNSGGPAGGPAESSPRRKPWDGRATLGCLSPGGAADTPAPPLSPLLGAVIMAVEPCPTAHAVGYFLPPLRGFHRPRTLRLTPMGRLPGVRGMGGKASSVAKTVRTNRPVCFHQPWKNWPWA